MQKTKYGQQPDGQTAGGGTGHGVEGDTPRVNREAIFLHAQLKTKNLSLIQKAAGAVTGQKEVVDIVVCLMIPEWVNKKFNIPVYSTVDAKAVKAEYQKEFYQRKDGSRWVYDPVKGAFVERKFTGGAVRKPNKTSHGVTKMSVRLNTDIPKKSGNGNVTVAISFPYWFNLMMVGQALSTMIKKNSDGQFRYQSRSYSYSTGEKTNARNDKALTGAWLTQAQTLKGKEKSFDGYYEVYSTGGAMVKSDNAKSKK
jgi:hypothetical protein